MRILLGHPMADEQTGHYIKRGFEELGHEIVGVHDSFLEPPYKFLEMAKKLKPDLIFTAKINYYNFVVEELSKIALFSFWSYDVRETIDLWLQDTGPLYQYAHFFFTIGKSDVQKYYDAGLPKAYWLPEGIDPTIHKPVNSLTFKDHLAYDCDVSLAGGIREEGGRRQLHEALQKLPLQYLHTTDVFNEEHNKLVKCSKINLGSSGWPMIECSMSARDYRIMGAEGFLLTNNVKGIEQWFEINKMCCIYNTPEEAIEKIKYYLEHEEERKRVAEYGCKVVHEKHKFSDRLAQVIEIAENYK